MRKNMNYILGLVSVIFISVFMNQYINKKKEGYVNLSCPEIINMANTLLKGNNLLAIQNINDKGIDGSARGKMKYTDTNVGTALSQIIEFFIRIDTFTLLMDKNPKFFSELFENPKLTDIDFTILYNSYHSFIFALHNIRMTIINININIKSTSRTPICYNISIGDVTSWYDYYNSNANKYINTFRKVLDNVNDTNTTKNTDAVFQIYIDQFTNSYNTILNVKECSKALLGDLTPENKKIIYPFLSLIQNYVTLCINKVNTTFVPALNAKLKNGQKILIPSVPYIKPENKDGPVVAVTPLGDGGLINTNNSLIQGVGASYP